MFFFFYKIGQQEGGTSSAHGGEVWHQREGGGAGERSRWVNMVQTMYTHVRYCKYDTCSNCSRNPGWGVKESSGGE
jgi:hypothetical protein